MPSAPAIQWPSTEPTMPITTLAMMPICALVFMMRLASQPMTPPITMAQMKPIYGALPPAMVRCSTPAPEVLASGGTGDHLAQLPKAHRLVSRRAQHDLVEAQPRQTVQALARHVGRTPEVTGVVGAIGARG